MTERDDGGPAFPTDKQGKTDHRGDLIEKHTGMSMRDHFAGEVICGMYNSMANRDFWPKEQDLLDLAKRAYAQADAMLEARKK